MKRIYTLLPKPWGQRLRGILEFDGGVSDKQFTRASVDVHPMSGHGPRYRPPPASMPQARIPGGPVERTYNIQYYTRDVRRNFEPTDYAIEASFSDDGKKFLEAPALIDQPKLGSPGVKNPDVERYDKTGTRTAMTTTHAAVKRELAKNRGGPHFPKPRWMVEGNVASWVSAHAGAGYEALPGKPETKPSSPWQYTQARDW